MREVAEFRIHEEDAQRHLEPVCGIALGDPPSVRKVTVKLSDPLYEKIGKLTRSSRPRIFAGWEIRRYYTKAELDGACLFDVWISARFEPTGEECGTVYDETTACDHCGAGVTQKSDLHLDLRRVPRGADLAATIADEWIVSQRLAELIVDHGITGCELRRVIHQGWYDDVGVDLQKVPSGRELLSRAKARGIPLSSGRFFVWLNRAAQSALWERAWQEAIADARKKDFRRRKPVPVWYQLVITARRVRFAPCTRFGIHPFDEDKRGKFRCPLGHVKGLNLLSEVNICEEDWDGSDITCTVEFVGDRMGLLRPWPVLLISQRLRTLLEDRKIKRYRLEVAHLRSGDLA